jgi:catechol 2,3-dioxygenase-like lactoylglutathione lyase family enzyme
MTGGARQMRLVVEVEDFDAAVAFFRDALGLPEEASFSGDGDERVVILQAGRATLELANPAHHQFVDRVEVGRPVAPRFRIAFEVADVTARSAEAVEAGAEIVAPPSETPWRSLNSRLDAPGDLQITLFEELDQRTG